MLAIFLELFVAIVAGIFGFTAGAAVTDSIPAAISIGILIAALTTILLRKFRILHLEKGTYSRGLALLSVAGIVAALVQLLRLSVFMIDPSQPEFSSVPWSKWEIQHSCLSAYYIADRATAQVQDIYSSSLYSLPDEDPTSIRKPRMLGPFRIDVYEYPPPFLLLPRIFSYFTADFLRIRMIWFAFNGALVLLGMLLIAGSLEPNSRSRALLCIPLVWAAIPTIGTLQKGNVQMTIIALSMIAMLLFAKRKFVPGGTLMAYATASKIYPGMLLFYLLLRRQWRAVLVTIAAGVLIALIAVYVAGVQSYVAFMKHLPGLLGGEAFPAFRNPNAMAINFSIPGIIFKLKIFGFPGMGFPASKILGWIYTVLLVGILVVVARRNNQSGQDHPIQWLAILVLATLRSPFLPQAYAAFPPLWLLTLMFANQIPNTKNLILFVFGWLALNIFVPQDAGINTRLAVLISSIPQAVSIGLPLWALLRPGDKNVAGLDYEEAKPLAI